MENRTVPVFALVVLVAVGGLNVSAQMGNGTSTVIQELMSSSGGRIGGGNPMAAQTILGLPASGPASNGTYTLIELPELKGGAVEPPVTMSVTVTGTVDDPSATLTVNGVPAVVSGTTFTAQGVLLMLGPNTITVTATDTIGNATSASIVVYLDLPAAKKTPRFSITVSGAVDDQAATVSVNGLQAAVAGGAFSVSVPLVSGLNVLAATATDQAGNAGTASIRVFVKPPSRPPAKPTIGTVGGPIPDITTANSVTVGGTKTRGTSIWMNGTQVAGLSDELIWTVTLNLTEGDNELTIVAKDATGTASAESVVNVIVDNLPPVVIFQPPAKTNFNPLLVAGSVDDSRTTVTMNGLSTTRAKRGFEASVSLALGPNTLHLVAVSPNGYRTERDYAITLGTIPSIQSVQPLDGTKLYLGIPVTLQASAVDQEADPIQYQFLIDGTVLADWSSIASRSWTPQAAQAGLHRLTIVARDAYGGSRTKDVAVFVVRKPLSPP